MTATISIKDGVLGPGEAEFVRELEFPSERITVRELIRERVYQEVDDYNRALRAELERQPIRLLIQPDRPDGSLLEIDWKQQFNVAIDAYERRQVLVLAGDRQTESLDEVITIERGVDVVFLRLVLLVGG